MTRISLQILVSLALVCVLAWGCASERPPATDTIVLIGPEEGRVVRTLDASGEAEIAAAFRSLAPPGEAGGGRSIVSGPSRVVLDSAVGSAVSRAGVEMAVVRRTDLDAGAVRYELRTIEHLPAELTIRPAASGAGEAFIAEASVGLFPERHRARAERLVTAFESELATWSRKRRLEGVEVGPLGVVTVEQ